MTLFLYRFTQIFVLHVMSSFTSMSGLLTLYNNMIPFIPFRSEMDQVHSGMVLPVIISTSTNPAFISIAK